MAEYWDIYDADRQKKRGTHLRGKPLADGDYHLVVNIWVYNSRGQVLLTQRHPGIPFGLKWACTGGSAIAGEDTLTAAVRETREEIGLTVQPQELILGRLSCSRRRLWTSAGWASRSTAAWSGRGYCTPRSKTFSPPTAKRSPGATPSANIFDDKRKEERIFLSLFLRSSERFPL